MRLDQLTIIHYPDPRLRRQCADVTEFDERLAALAARMLELMREAKGVGLAAPQVGVLLRVFVMNPTGEPDDDLVIVNPRLNPRREMTAAEEGCLSLPDVRCEVRRATRCALIAQTLTGERVQLEGDEFISRIWQHETDHLNGVLIIDRMTAGDRIATRRQLKHLEARYKGA